MSEFERAIQKDELDCEWLELILIARNLGITIEEVRNFLLQSVTSFN